jgi:hypothetical protein
MVKDGTMVDRRVRLVSISGCFFSLPSSLLPCCQRSDTYEETCNMFEGLCFFAIDNFHGINCMFPGDCIKHLHFSPEFGFSLLLLVTFLFNSCYQLAYADSRLSKNNNLEPNSLSIRNDTPFQSVVLCPLCYALVSLKDANAHPYCSSPNSAENLEENCMHIFFRMNRHSQLTRLNGCSFFAGADQGGGINLSMHNGYVKDCSSLGPDVVPEQVGIV